MEPKMEPKRSQGGQKTPPGPVKKLQRKQPWKKIPQGPKKKPVLAREREARLKEESLTNMGSTAVWNSRNTQETPEEYLRNS